MRHLKYDTTSKSLMRRKLYSWTYFRHIVACKFYIPQNIYHKVTYLSWMVNRYLNTNFLKKQNWFCILISSLLYFRIHEYEDISPKQNPGGVGCSLNYEQGSCINAIYYLSKASCLDVEVDVCTNPLVCSACQRFFLELCYLL